MSVISFFKNRTFFIHIGLAIGATIALVWLLTLFLSVITKHGQEIIVPDLTGMKKNELNDFLSEKGLEYEIIDSVYDSNGKKGTVISQDPFANSKVKSGRKIYITIIASLPERVAVPDLKDLTLRQTISVLETYGLKAGKLEYVPDIAQNVVLKQKYKGNIIEPGTMIEKGSVIDLVLGKGKKNETTSVPFLLGKTQDEAHKLLNQYSLNVGEETFSEGADTNNAKVYKQNPVYSPKSSVSLGTAVNLQYKSDKQFDFNTFLKKHKNDTIENEK